MQRRYELSDEEWHLIQDLFPPPKKMGRPRRDDRTLFNGVFWILCSGAAWRNLTSPYCSGTRFLAIIQSCQLAA